MFQLMWKMKTNFTLVLWKSHSKKDMIIIKGDFRHEGCSNVTDLSKYG